MVWCRLYSDILGEYGSDGKPNKLFSLPDNAVSLYFFLLAMACKFDNKIPADFRYIEMQSGRKNCEKTIKILIDCGIIVTSATPAQPLRTDCALEEIRVETETDTETEESLSGDSEAEHRTAELDDPIYLDFLIRDKDPKKRTWYLRRSLLNEFHGAYGKQINVLQEAVEARMWCIAHAEKRKTARGMPSFLWRWFQKAVNQEIKKHPPVSSEQAKAEAAQLLRAREAAKRKTQDTSQIHPTSGLITGVLENMGGENGGPVGVDYPLDRENASEGLMQCE